MRALSTNFGTKITTTTPEEWAEEASHKHAIMGGGAKEKVRIMNKLLEYV